MKHRLMLTACVAGVAAFLSAGAATAATTQLRGLVDPNLHGSVSPDGCGKVHTITVSAPSRIQGTVAATNAGGYVYLQILGPGGAVRSSGGTYDAPSGGAYGVRVCFNNGDGIDQGPVTYVALVTTT